MFSLIDTLLTFVHFSLVLFNLFGWLPIATRKAHFVCIVLTAASWFLLGLWFGVGYCPLTDWQWQVKAKLGEGALPPELHQYFAEKLTGKDFSSQLVSTLIGLCFAIAALLSVYVNFILPVRTRKAQSPQ